MADAPANSTSTPPLAIVCRGVVLGHRGVAQRSGDLQRAAGIRGHEQFGAGRRGGPNRVGLAQAKFPGRLGLQQVVHPRRTAAGAAVADLDQSQARDGRKQRAGLITHALRVRQVTRVVVCHGQRQRVPPRYRAEVGEELGDVADLPGEAAAGRLTGAARDQIAVLLHCRTAASRVHDHRVDRRPAKDVHQVACERGRFISAPGVQRKRAAATLAARNDHVAPLGRENPRGGGVHLRKELSLHAAGEHPDDGAARPAGRHQLRQPYRPGRRRREPERRPRPRWQPPCDPASRDQPVHARPLRGAQRDRKDAQPARIGEHREDRGPGKPLRHRTRLIKRPCPRALDQPVVLHARRAGRHARHAAQAAIQVLKHRVSQRSPLHNLGHEVDPPAR